jgi:Clp amino terminal domain, pathogenicity island component
MAPSCQISSAVAAIAPSHLAARSSTLSRSSAPTRTSPSEQPKPVQARRRLLGGLDRAALAAIGIDLDTVQARIESSFRPEALTQAGQAVQRKTRARPAWHRPRLSSALIRRWHRRRRNAMAPIPLRAATGLWRRDRGAAVFHPFTPNAQRSLESIRREARAQHDTRPGVEHVALALISMTDGPVPVILASLGVTPPALRTAILNGYRRAS